jgi:hypothetical protein
MMPGGLAGVLTCMSHDWQMNDSTASDPTEDSITSYIRETYPETVVAEIEGARFFSLDEKHWPNYATIVWSEEFDDGSNLARPGVFRLNMWADRATLERLAAEGEPDYAALDRLIPHPVYAAQRWVSILNPSAASFTEIVVPMLRAAHDRLARQRPAVQNPLDIKD